MCGLYVNTTLFYINNLGIVGFGICGGFYFNPLGN
jgi:hypothetical protein